jgi:hypothetical protein
MKGALLLRSALHAQQKQDRTKTIPADAPDHPQQQKYKLNNSDLNRLENQRQPEAGVEITRASLK